MTSDEVYRYAIIALSLIVFDRVAAQCINDQFLIFEESVELCCNNNIVISPDQDYTEYLWSTGETTKSISVDRQGVYHLEVLPDGASEWLCDSIVVLGCVPDIDTICWTSDPIPLDQLGLTFLNLDGIPMNAFLRPDLFPTDTPLEADYTYDCDFGCTDCIVVNETIVIVRSGDVGLLPNMHLDTSNLNICANLHELVPLIADVPGGTFSSNALSIIVQNDTFYIDPATSATGTLSYDVVSGGCPITTTWSISIVQPQNVVFQNLPGNPVCTNDPQITLTATPPGGQFFLEGEPIGNLLIPADIAQESTLTLLYTGTDANGCAVEGSRDIWFRPPPIVSMIQLNAKYCQNDPNLPLVGLPSGGHFVLNPPGTPILNNVLNLSNQPPGPKEIVYSYSDAYCTNSVTRAFTLYAPPQVRILNIDSNFCETEGPIALQASPGNGDFSPDEFASGIVRPQDLDVKSYSVRYTYVDNNGCQNSDEFRFDIEPLPIIRLDHIYTCVPNTLTFLNFSQSINTIDSDWRVDSGPWFTQNASPFQLPFNSPGQHDVSLQVYDIHGCTSDTAFSVDVPVYNTSAIRLSDSITLSGEEVAFHIDPSTPLANYLWFFGDGAISADSVATHSYVLSGVYDIALSTFDIYGCPDTAFTKILIKDHLDISFDVVNLYPNPARDFITVEYYLPERASLIVAFYDEAGRYIKEYIVQNGGQIPPGPGQFDIPVDDLDPGFYALGFFANDTQINGAHAFRRGELAAERLKPLNHLKLIKLE